MGEHETDQPEDDQERTEASAPEGLHPSAEERTMFEVEDEELA
jgi:hypothetical protein